MIYLDTLLQADNFRRTVDELASDFREKYNLGPINQLGLVVPEVETAAGQLEKRGIGPFLILSGSLARWDEQGKPGHFRGKLGLARHQGVDLELLEPGEGSDFYRQDVDPEDRIVVQHLGFLVRDVDKQMKTMNDDGHPTRVRGKIKNGPLSVEFAYMDTVSTAGLIIELISFRLLGVGVKPFGPIYHFMGRLEKRCGIRCINMP